jgi:PASTA domain/IPT/TIG domain
VLHLLAPSDSLSPNRVQTKGDGVSRFPRLPILIATAAATLALCSTAQAIITVGSPSTTPVRSILIENPVTFINSGLSEPGANLVSPVSGTIVRWHVTGFEGGPFWLRVLTPLGGNSYTGSGTSAAVVPTSLATQTYPADLPIQAGQTIGVDNANGTDEEGYATGTGASSFFLPPLADGATATPTGPSGGGEFTFNAEVLAPPDIAAIGPTDGSILGGTSVVIAGHDFTDAKAVRFGKVPATGFSVNSDNAITAVSPPSAVAGTVDVSVTTAAGTTPVTTADRFTYVPGSVQPRHCVVPNLKGKKLKASKKKLKAGDCKIGKVKKLDGATAKTGKVVKQHPKPGKVLAPGSTVSVKLGV